MCSLHGTKRDPYAGSLRLVHRLVGGIALAALLATASPALADPPFNLTLSTSKGCFETGQNPVFIVGEHITVFFRIGGTVPQAQATLFDILPNGFVNVFNLGSLSTNVTYAFTAKIAPPLGIEQLLLRASAMGMQTTQRSCSFRIISATPHPTRTPTATPTSTETPPTKTPTASKTMTRTGTMSPSPAAGLSGSIRTNRGCLEDGDTPIFAVGESVLVSFRVNSMTMSQAKVSIADMLPNGSTNVFGFGFLQTNVNYAFSAGIAPPLGTETLELRAGSSVPQTVLDHCSFMVVSGSSMTPSRTRTKTRTRTPSQVPTPTSTPTPTV